VHVEYTWDGDFTFALSKVCPVLTHPFVYYSATMAAASSKKSKTSRVSVLADPVIV